MRIDLFLHDSESDGATSHKLDTILAHLLVIETRLGQLMSSVSDVKQLISDINDETNAVAARVDEQAAAIQALKDQIATGVPATQEDLDVIGSGLSSISTRLKAVGADPATPIPPVDVPAA